MCTHAPGAVSLAVDSPNKVLRFDHQSTTGQVTRVAERYMRP